MFKFTVEETTFMTAFDTSSRLSLIDDLIHTPINELDDEMVEMMYRIVMKLETMTDEEYHAIHIGPEEEPEVEE